MNLAKNLSLFAVLFLCISLNGRNKDSSASLIAKGISFGLLSGLAANAAVTAVGAPIQLIVWPTSLLLRLALAAKNTKNFDDEQIVNNTSCLASWAVYFIPLTSK